MTPAWPWDILRQVEYGHLCMLDLEIFYAKVKYGHLGICMGKSENYLFFENYCSP